MIIKGYVYDEINWAEVIDFFDIITDRISLEMPCIGIRADHVLVVFLNGSSGGYAWHDSFHATAVARKVMVFDIAKKDAAVCISDCPEDIDRSSVLAVSHVFHIIGITVNAFDAVVHIFANKAFHFFLGLLSVRAKSENNSDILVFDACFFQFVQDAWHDDPGRHRACYVACHDDNLFTRMNNFTKLRRVNRIFQCSSDFSFLGLYSRTFSWIQFDGMMFITHMKWYVILEVFNFKFHFSISLRETHTQKLLYLHYTIFRRKFSGKGFRKI